MQSRRFALLAACAALVVLYLAGCGGGGDGPAGRAGPRQNADGSPDGDAQGGPDGGNGDGDANGADPRAAERIVIRFQGGAFELLSRIPLAKLLPPSAELAAGALPRSGFWFELQSGDGSVRYRRFGQNPVLLAFEGPDIDNGGTVPDRIESIPAERVFTLLVPAPQPGDRLVLFSSPLEPGAQAAPAQEVARFELEQAIEQPIK